MSGMINLLSYGLQARSSASCSTPYISWKLAPFAPSAYPKPSIEQETSIETIIRPRTPAENRHQIRAPACTIITMVSSTPGVYINSKGKKTFVPLENNPEVFTDLIHRLGLTPELGCYDVYSIDEPDLLSMVPRPAHALIFIS